MDETDGRLAPVSYLFGARPSDSPVPTQAREGWATALGGAADNSVDEPAWNDAWGTDVDNSCARLSDDDRDRAAEAERIAMRALTRRDHSRRELERVLRNNGVEEADIEFECERLIRVGLLNDDALAQKLVATLQERKGLGRSAIAAELTKRLLSPAAIEYALELVDTGDELERARELARKRAAQLSGLDRDAAVRRLSGYLARRGYSGSTVRTAVDEALRTRPTGHATVRFR